MKGLRFWIGLDCFPARSGRTSLLCHHLSETGRSSRTIAAQEIPSSLENTITIVHKYTDKSIEIQVHTVYYYTDTNTQIQIHWSLKPPWKSHPSFHSESGDAHFILTHIESFSFFPQGIPLLSSGAFGSCRGYSTPLVYHWQWSTAQCTHIL